MLLLPVTHGINEDAGLSGLQLNFGEYVGDSGNKSTYTFTGAAFPNPQATRRCVVAVVGHDNFTTRDINSVTIDGNTATYIGTTSQSRDEIYVALYHYAVAAGSTLDVVVTWNGQMDDCSIGTFALLNSGATHTDVDATTEDPANGMTSILNIPANSIAFMVCGNANTNSITFTAGEDETSYNQGIGGGGHQAAFCIVNPTGSARSSHNITSSFASSADGGAQIGAVFAPA